MPFTIEQKPRSKVIDLSFDGAVNRKQLIEACQRVYSINAKDEYLNILIDMRNITWDMSMVDIYNFAKAITLPPHMRTAIIHRIEDDEACFLVTVANSYRRRIKSFTDYTEAMKDVDLFSRPNNLKPPKYIANSP